MDPACGIDLKETGRGGRTRHEYIEGTVSMKTFIFFIKKGIYHSSNSRDKNIITIHK